MIQLPELENAWPIPIVQSAPTARMPSSMCSAIKFNPIPDQNAMPETKASNPAKLKTADAIRITIEVFVTGVGWNEISL